MNVVTPRASDSSSASSSWSAPPGGGRRPGGGGRSRALTRRSRVPSSRSSGFTLLELVVALAVAGSALGFGVAGFALVVDRRESVEESVDRDLEAAALRASLRSWIRGARVGGGTGAIFSGMDSRTDSEEPRAAELPGSGARVAPEGRMVDLDRTRPNDELTVTTAARTPLDAPLTRVRIFVDRDPETAERGLVAELLDPVALDVHRLELDPAARGFDVRYLSEVTGATRWLPSWVSSSVLPRGLELRVVHDLSAEAHPLLDLPLRVALDGGR